METPRADFDVLLLGCGGAGLAILHQLAARADRLLRVAVVDPVNRLARPVHDRTWCFWLPSSSLDDGWVGQVAVGRWRSLEVVTPARRQIPVDPAPLEYVMVTSDRYARLVAEQVAASSVEVTWFTDPSAADEIQARWEFDSRPDPGQSAGLWQNFHGEFRRFREPVFDPDRATLMDFSVPQQPGQTAFCYVLPLDQHTALLEYTRFTPNRLEPAEYRQALAAHVARLDLGRSTVLHAEQGAIPMSASLGRWRLRSGRFGVGTAGGATRASTGYTFAAMQRQAAAIAQAVVAGERPVPPAAYSRRHRLLDRVMLQALDDGMSGPEFFSTFFEVVPGATALRFLDGTSSTAEDLQVVGSIPPGPMLAATAHLLRPRG